MRRARRTSGGPISGINITPFTDVVLVLLIIFMVATPLLIESGVKVNLPKAASGDAQPEKSVVVTIDAVGNVYLDRNRVALADLPARFSEAMRAAPGAPVIIRGDREIRYDLVVRVLEIARASGARRLALGVELQR